jgi:hypothetical protein
MNCKVENMRFHFEPGFPALSKALQCLQTVYTPRMASAPGRLDWSSRVHTRVCIFQRYVVGYPCELHQGSSGLWGCKSLPAYQLNGLSD